MNEAALQQQLCTGAEALGLALDTTQIQQLLAYQGLIAKWTKVYNLTAVRNPEDMLTHHLLDSLAIVAPLQAHIESMFEPGSKPTLLDVGSGAGLPGVVLAICCRALQITCVDAVNKKAAFIRQVALALQLPNLHGLHARIESITSPFDIISARAFASLADFTAGSQAALAPGGVWLAMKGKYPSDEIADLPSTVEMFHVKQLEVPGLHAERWLLWLRRQ